MSLVMRTMNCMRSNDKLEERVQLRTELLTVKQTVDARDAQSKRAT